MYTSLFPIPRRQCNSSPITLTGKPALPLTPSIFLHPPSLSALSRFLFFLSPDSLRALQWNAEDFCERVPKLYFILLFPVNLICIRVQPQLFFVYLDTRLFDLIALTPGLVFFFLIIRTLAAVLSFSSHRSHFFSTPCFFLFV